MPLPTLQRLADEGRADLEGLASGTVRITRSVSGIPEGAPIPCPAPQHDPPARLAAMAAAGVTHHVVSPPPFLFGTLSDPDAVAEGLADAVNEGLAEYVAYDDRALSGFGFVPVGSAAAITVARRCLDDLGFAGVTMGTFSGDRELDDPVNEPLWELLAARRVPILLHPSRPVSVGRFDDFWLTQTLGYPMETTLAVSRLYFSGVLARHDLRFVLSHGGGCLPSVLPRLDHSWRTKPQARTTAVAPSDVLGSMYVDTCVLGPTQLAHLVDVFGADHVVLGSDFPFDLGDPDPVGSVRALGLSAPQQTAILSATATRLLAWRSQ